MTTDDGRWVTGIDGGRSKRSLDTGHRIADYRHGHWVTPRQTRYLPRLWLVEHYRRRKARRLGKDL